MPGKEAFYRGEFKRVTLGRRGHFLHRERPDAAVDQIHEFIA